MVPLSKSGVRKHRGFESRPLRHLPPPERPWGRQRLRSSLTESSGRWLAGASLGLRSGRLGSAFALTAIRQNVLASTHDGLERLSSASWRGRLVDYGAALEMRFGETRRGFESRP